VIHQGQSEVSRGKVKCEDGKLMFITLALDSEGMCSEWGR
jgi:hypothetical protein